MHFILSVGAKNIIFYFHIHYPFAYLKTVFMQVFRVFFLWNELNSFCLISEAMCFTSLISPELSPTRARSFHKCNVPKFHYFASSVLQFCLYIPVQCFLFSFQIDTIDSHSVCGKTSSYFSEDCCLIVPSLNIVHIIIPT